MAQMTGNYITQSSIPLEGRAAFRCCGIFNAVCDPMSSIIYYFTVTVHNDTVNSFLLS